MSNSWLNQEERGNIFAMKLIAYLAVTFGRRIGRLLLYPVCLYFYLFAPQLRRASKTYLGLVFNRRPSWHQVYRHLFYFASTLLDRAFLMAGRQHYFIINKYGLDTLRNVIDGNRGCLFLGAHLGSFELVRFGGAKNWGLTINLMMYEENAQKIKHVVESIENGIQLKILPIGGIDSLIRAKDRLDKGEMLAILGDRTISDDKVITVPFFGKPVAFPTGPILAACVLKVPVVLFFGLYFGKNKYEEHFELFAEQIVIDRHHRERDILHWVEKFAQRLEHYCRKSPYCWFNFYDYWRLESKDLKKLPELTPSSHV